MSRFVSASLMNLLVPGTGLIVLAWPWQGLAISVWFGIGGEVAMCGSLIAPAVIPVPATVTGLLLAVAAWLLGQGLLLWRVRFLRRAKTSGDLDVLRRLAAQALERSDYAAARSAVRLALVIDDSNVADRALWARLLSACARPASARRAWRAVERLDADRRFTEEIRQALGRLGAN